MKYKNLTNDIQNHLKIYNSLTGKKEFFKPIHNNKYVGIYVCGPTVYNYLHIGNCRTFISFDIVYRYLKHLGYKVRYVRNITDVGHLENEKDNGEDKICKKSRIEGIEPMEIVQKYTIHFHKLLNILNILPPNIEPTATGHIIEQIDIIKKLISNKLAYEINGSVYFDLNQYCKLYSYGILSKNKIKKLFNQKISFSEEKRSYQDFSLWKRAHYNHIMKWNSPWGEGFPGWHIECTTMSTKYLGEYFDIHGGGIDLKFPHHECEIAQAIGAYNNNFVRYWMHTNMLTLNGKKMSKSTNNFLYLDDVINKFKLSPSILRFFILKTHYRNILNFSYEDFLNAKKGFYKIMKSINILNNINSEITKENNIFNVKNWIYDCYKSINDDFNIPLLITHLFKATHFINSFYIKNMDKYHIFLFKKYMNYFVFDILGLQYKEKNTSKEDSDKLKKLIKKLIEIRIEARKQKNWILSDRIRKELYSIGISLNDEKLF
ncbi:cysteine--tRNA ligase [Blattabacterium cuenoti]|uniref:cysteine--tRNA ligase n=1 Tax=Blattabacterium cuenoti TaxID=1653831 RepID=UPI00163C433E|nr:cysteine--tRNA ligase [Blattabacterium cuenoti]